LLTQIAVWPLLAWTVGRGSLVGLPANLLAVPLAAALLVCGAAAAASSACLSAAGAPLWWVADALGRALCWLARLGWDRVGLGTSLVATPASWIVMALAALLVRAHGPPRWRAAALAAFAVVAAL